MSAAPQDSDFLPGQQPKMQLLHWKLATERTWTGLQSNVQIESIILTLYGPRQ